MAGRTVVGFEALLRWTHPVRGPISPVEFIPIAEDTGLILKLGEWVLLRACRDALAWPADMIVAVNLSVSQFKHRDLTGQVRSALERTGLPANRLELEITENVLIQDTEATLETLNQLRQLGVGISMDDFGTGYSSLSYLRKFPFDKIKLDRSFVSGVDDLGTDAAIVRTVLSLARDLGMTATAEGVETQDQLIFLRQEGCPQVQGFLIGRPMPQEQLRSYLDTAGAGDDGRL
jgi:EAL domain-containing protein (putative c-di-GMP-specific phosphodiesterase class I)